MRDKHSENIWIYLTHEDNDDHRTVVRRKVTLIHITFLEEVSLTTLFCHFLPHHKFYLCHSTTLFILFVWTCFLSLKHKVIEGRILICLSLY